jgi:hypothetical protein
VDVLDGFWRFFAEDGSPLEARWSEPVGPGGTPGSAYTLERAMSGLWLQERLEKVVAVTGCGLTTVAELVELLKINRGKRVEAERLARPPGIS